MLVPDPIPKDSSSKADRDASIDALNYSPPTVIFCLVCALIVCSTSLSHVA